MATTESGRGIGMSLILEGDPSRRWSLLPDLPGDYPRQWVTTLHARGGQQFTVRPILAQDDWLLAELVNGATPAVKHRRFPSAMAHVVPAALHRLTCVDYCTHLALVVIGFDPEGNEHMVAESRYVIDPDGRSAEFALMVDERWQRRRIGSALVKALGHAAAAAGVVHLRGEVMRENVAMLALMKHCRFRHESDDAVPRVVQVASRPLRPQGANAQNPDWQVPWLRALGTKLKWTGRSP